MIWSSRARNRSFDPVVLCFFGRIVPSDAPQNHAPKGKGIQKRNCRVRGSQAPNPCNLKCPYPKNRLSLNRLEACSLTTTNFDVKMFRLPALRLARLIQSESV